MRYGELDLHALPEGRFTVGLDKVFVPYRDGDPMPSGGLFVSVTPLLVRTPHDVLLLDAGLGEWARGQGVEVLLENLRKHGVARESVTRVLLSHLHFDHLGGAVFSVAGERRPTFPNAEYVVQRAELTAAGYKRESVAARDAIVDVLDRAGQLRLLDGDGPVAAGVAAVVTNGHTGAHQLFRLDAGGGRQAVFAGDVLASAGQARRRFVAKYDVDGRAAADWRARLVREAADGGHLLLFYHDADAPAAFIAEGPRGAVAAEPVAL